MKHRRIFITEHDKKRLEDLIAATEESGNRDGADLSSLAAELANANVVSSQEVPSDVVTMNSVVRLRDVETGAEMTYTLVFPGHADVAAGAISVLAPVGTGLLGYAKGDIVEWPVPAGIRRLSIEDILYQPEAEGDFHL